MTNRRDFLRHGTSLFAGAFLFRRLPPAAGVPMVVYKDPNCGCCAKWVDLMKGAGFDVSTRDTPNMDPIKARYNVGRALASCHTAVVGGYVVEGHVPADDIKRLLKEKPAVLGIAAPGMPMGSPGMEGSPKDAYAVLTFDRSGKTTVFARH